MDKSNNLPHIIKVNNSDYELPPQYFIALEQDLIAECGSLVKALYTVFAIHYAYNVVYHPQLKNFYAFFEEKLFEFAIKGPKTALYSSVVVGIESFAH